MVPLIMVWVFLVVSYYDFIVSFRRIKVASAVANFVVVCSGQLQFSAVVCIGLLQFFVVI